MPRHVEVILDKMIKSFMWDGKKPSVNADTLCLPAERGGIALLDLTA